MRYKQVRLDQLNFPSTPVRQQRSETYMRQLKASLKATDGPIDPVILRDIGSSEYIIVAGESRVKALLELGYPPNYKVPALLGDFDDRKALEYGLVDNYVRAPITAYEEALVVLSLVLYYDMSQRDIADKLGKAEQHISRLLSVFDLIEEVQNALHGGCITLGHAVEIHALLDSPKKQRKLLAEITERGLNVKATRTRVRELLGEGEDWIIRPGEVWVSKEARVSIHPSGKGYKVDFSFATADEFDKIVTVLRNRLNWSGDPLGVTD